MGEKQRYEQEREEEESEDEKEESSDDDYQNRRGPKVIERPKQPTHAYAFFVQENRSKIAEQNPDKSPPEIIRMISDAWKNIQEQDKSYYQSLAAEDKKRFKQEMKSLSAQGY